MKFIKFAHEKLGLPKELELTNAEDGRLITIPGIPGYCYFDDCSECTCNVCSFFKEKEDKKR